MKILLYKGFDKQYQKLDRSKRERVKERLNQFLENPFNPILNNHALRGKYLDYRSINITGDLRAIYKMLGDDEAIFIAVDTHSHLYQ